MSHSLGRLRELLGDELLVRIGTRMELTPRAVSLRGSLPDALERVRSLLATESFVPATSSRRSDRDVVVVRRDHPLRTRLGILRTFVEARHIAVTRDPLDTWLLKKGVERRIGLTVPSYLQALHAAAASDLAAFVPQRLAEALATPLSLAIVKPPIDPGPYQEFLFYPRRRDGDAAARWLRDIVVAIGSKIGTRNTRRRRPTP